MISSLNKKLILGLCLSASTVMSQSTAPETPGFMPSAPQIVPAAPHSTLTIPAQQEPGTLSSAAKPAPTIAVEPVGAPSIAGIGVLDERNGGQPAAIWNGTSYENATALLAWMNGGVSHKGLNDLVQNLLMSRVTPPAGAPDSWFAERVDALIAMGQDEKAEQMIAAVPASMTSDPLEQTRASLLLLRGDVEGAAKLTEKALHAPGADTAFWQRINIICKAATGKKDEALLALDVMQEAGKEDPFLREVVRRIGDKSAPVKTLPTRWSLIDTAAMMIAGEPEKLKDRLDALPPLALKYFAANEKLDPKLREKAAAKAIQIGIIPPKDLSKAPPTPFARPLASDITTLVTSFGSGNPPSDADNIIIARLVVDETAALQDTRRVQRLLSVMEPFGYRVPSNIWSKLFSRKGRFDGDIPPAPLLDKLNSAAQGGRKAEIVLLSALILGSDDVERIHEILLLPVIKSLIAAGFTKEAHSIAYDAIQSYRIN